MKGNLHLVSGEKGGVGSSLFCRALIEYYQNQDFSDLVIIDGEIEHLLGKIYAPNLYQDSSISPLSSIQFDSQLKCYQLDFLLDLVVSGNQVVVNIPSRSFSIIDDWLNPLNLEDLASANSVKIWRWFTSDGSAESLDILKKSYQLYGDLITHVIVKNPGSYRTIPKSWLSWNNDVELQSYLEKYQTYLLIMPTLSLPDYRWDIIHQNHLTLTQAKARYQQGITILEKQKIHTWLKTMFHGLSSILLVDFNRVDDDELVSLF